MPSTFTVSLTNSQDLHFSNMLFPFSVPILPLPWVTMSQHSPKAVQNIVTICTHQWRFLHTLLYQNRNNHLNAKSHWQLPWELTRKKFSNWCCPTFKSCNILVFSKQFFPLKEDCAPDGHLQCVTILDAVYYNLTSWWWAHSAQNMYRNIINLL